MIQIENDAELSSLRLTATSKYDDKSTRLMLPIDACKIVCDILDINVF